MTDPSFAKPDDIPYVLPATDPEVPAATFRDVPWKTRDLLIGLGVPLTGLVVMTLMRYAVPEESRRAIPLFVHIILLVSWIALYIAMGLCPLWLARRRLPAFTWCWPSWSELVRELSVALLVLPGMWMLILLVRELFARFSSSDANHDLMELTERVGPHPFLIVMWILAFTMAPLFEELFFRAFLHNALRRFLPALLASLLQSAIFGLFHPFSLLYVGAVFVIGLCLTGLYEWRRTLLAPMCLHGLHNMVGALGAFYVMFLVAHAPVLGIQGETTPQGFRLTHVAPATPAEKAGLQPGDIIIQIDEEGVASLEDVRRVLRLRKAGDRVRILYLHEGQQHEVAAVLMARPSP